MSIYVSSVNLVRTATVTASSEASGFDADEVKYAHRPGKPWRSTVTTDSWIVANFGASMASTTLLVLLNRAGFAGVKVQGNATDAWGAPTYNPHASTNLTIPRNPFTTRYTVGHLAAAWTFQFLRAFIPSQTPIIEQDGGTAPAYHHLGGLWAGAAEALPRGWRWDYTLGPYLPRERKEQEHRAWSRTSKHGRGRAMLSGTLQLEITGENPGIGDQLATYLDLQRRIFDRGPFAVVCDYGSGNYHSFVMEDDSDPPSIDYPLATVQMRWVEAV